MLKSEYIIELLKGLMVTIELFAIAWVLAFSIALILVTIRTTNIRPCRWFVDIYVEYHRNVPLLVQVMFWYFGMVEILPDNWRYWLYDHNAELSLAAIALGLGSAAYMAEDIRSGLRAIPKAQYEAASALGCNFFKSMRHIIVPQAIRLSIPALISRTVLLFKNTSIAMAIGVAELSYRADEINTISYKTFAVFTAATLMYLVGTSVIMLLGSLIYKHFSLSSQVKHA